MCTAITFVARDFGRQEEWYGQPGFQTVLEWDIKTLWI